VRYRQALCRATAGILPTSELLGQCQKEANHEQLQTQLGDITHLPVTVVDLVLTYPHYRVPKNGVSRSKRLLKPRPLPHHDYSLELRTSLTEAGDGAKFTPHFESSIETLLAAARISEEKRFNSTAAGKSCWT